MTSFQLQQRVDQSVMVVKITDFGNYTSWKDVRDVVQSVGRRDNMENDELATASVHLIVSDPKVRVVCVTSDDRHYFTLTYTPPPTPTFTVRNLFHQHLCNIGGQGGCDGRAAAACWRCAEG